MAITYFAFTAADPDDPVVSDAVAYKARGFLHCWVEGTPNTPSAKWVVVGDDILAADDPGLRSISTQNRNRIITALNAVLAYSRADLAQYGRSLGRGFQADVALPAATVNAL